MAEPRLSVGANFAWTLAGNVVYAASQWGMLVALAKVGSPVIVGTFALALAICSPVMMLTGLNLRAVQSTDAAETFPFRAYLGARLAGVGVALAVITAIGFGANRNASVVVAILLMAAAKAVEQVSDIVFGLFQQRERMDFIARSMLVKGPLGLALLVLAMRTTGDLALGITGLTVAGLALLLAYEVPMARRLLGAGAGRPAGWFPSLRPAADRSELLELAWLAAPLGVVMGLVTLEPNLPRYVLQHDLGLGAVGIYSSMAYLMIAGNTIVSSLNQAASPRLAALYASGDRGGFARLLGRLMAISLAVGAAGLAVSVFAGRELLALLYTPEYAVYPGVFVTLMVAALLGYLFGCLGVAITAMRLFKIQAPIHGALVLVILGTSVVLVRIWGVQGAALSLALGMAFGSAVYALVAAIGLRPSRPGAPESVDGAAA